VEVAVSVKTIGVLFGMEDTFPWALCHEINELARRRGLSVKGEPVQIGHISQEQGFAYDVILDRISHEVPFYRTFLKCAAARGVQVVNSPFWWSADDKFFDNVVARAVGVAVPRTVLLPHKEHPPNTTEKSFRNMGLVDWDEVFRYLGFPIFMKPAYGGGWKDVYKVHSREEFFEAYDKTHTLTMMAQEAIEFTDYYRCWVAGRRKVKIIPYAPKEPHESRYSAVAGQVVPDDMALRVTRDALALCDALGYDMNTVEFAVRDGVPYAIDFMNCAPDADLNSVGEETFRWIVTEMADFLVERVLHPVSWEPTGTWPKALGLQPR
jgi:glutathione synthase/RimK-type ligase-like ATP-grasp enzyme